MMLKFTLCFLVFVCNNTTPAESSINVGDVVEWSEGFFENFKTFARSFDGMNLEIACAESVDLITTPVVDESGEQATALITAIIDSSKCRDRSQIVSDTYCVVRIFRGLTWESKLFDMECRDSA